MRNAHFQVQTPRTGKRVPGRRMRLWFIRAAVILGLLLGLGGALRGMQSQHTASSTGQLGGIAALGPDDDPIEQEKRLKAINADRQKSLVADTNKLLKLAEELNAELNGTPPESLNPAQLRKVEEIEKLAKSVREKMSTSVKGIPVFEPLPRRIN